MTTYGEAFETAIMSNLAQGISEEVQCAGNTVSKFGKREDITESEKALVGHVLAHLSTVLNMIGVAEKYGADKLDEFDEENPGKLEAMSDELGESKIIKDLQDAMGMNADDIAALAALKEAAIEAEKAEAN